MTALPWRLDLAGGYHEGMEGSGDPYEVERFFRRHPYAWLLFCLLACGVVIYWFWTLD
jgi:hypothetical protein